MKEEIKIIGVIVGILGIVSCLKVKNYAGAIWAFNWMILFISFY